MKRQKISILKKALSVFLVGVILVSVMPVTKSSAEDGDNKKRIMVSLGDSYSSGEGIEPYYGYDSDLSKKVTNPDWLAHRSQKSWPGMLTLPSVDGKMADHKDDNWYFAAISGAETVHMNTPFPKDYDKSDLLHTYKDTKNLDPQLDIFKKDGIKAGEVDYVTVTIGGNDVDFAGTVTECAMKNSYFHPNALTDKLNGTWDNFFKEGGTRDALLATYQDIEQKAGKQAHIIVAGYPRLFDGALLNVFIDGEEADKINESVSKFNNAIAGIVNQCRGTGMDISFVSVEDAFKGHGAYSIDPYIFPIQIGVSSEDILDLIPAVKGNQYASAASIHPNEMGAQAYAKCVQEKINELEDVDSNVNYKKDFQLSVYDKNDYLYGNYKIEITGKEFTGLFKLGIFKKDYHKTITVDSSKKVDIHLPQGDYTICVTDGANEELSSKREVKVRTFGKNKELTFRTDFGEIFGQDESGEGKDASIINANMASSVRNVVLSLDVSGSMVGTPLDETKKASEKFINTVLNEDASIGVVTYENFANITSGFSNDGNALKGIISELNAGGGTNIGAGLEDAQWMLQNTSSKKKIIVLMSDGEPTTGLLEQDLIDRANQIKSAGTMIYTIGFFEDLTEKSSAQYLMEKIASDGCHYEVANADDLVFFFEDMADQINGQKYIYVRIACPVDVSVTHNGEILDSSEENLNERTSFGTLTFEENAENTEEYESMDEESDDRVKVLRLKEGEDYDIKISGTGRGVMNYTIGFMDENGDYSDLRRFEDVRITRNTKIDTVASHTDKTTMNIDEDGDGKYDLRLRAGENGLGKQISLHDWIYYVVIGAIVFVVIDILVIAIYIKRKRRARRGY